MSYSRNGDALSDSDALQEFARATAGIVSDPSFPATCHVLNATTRVCAPPLSFLELNYGPDVQLGSSVQLDVPPHSPVARLDQSAALHLAPPSAPALLRHDMNASERRSVLYRYADPTGAADRGVIGQQEVQQYRRFAPLFFDRDFGRVLDEGDDELEEQRAKGEDYGVSLRSRYMRVRITQGAPLEGFENEEDRPVEQRAEWGELMGDAVDEINIDRFNEKDPPAGLEIVAFSSAVVELEIGRRIGQDLTWALASIMFVFVYTWFHTGSIMLAGSGLLIILSAMLYGTFIYRVIFQVQFLQTLHALSIFILLGLSADAVFLVQDSWQQAPTPRQDAIEQRMHDEELAGFVRDRMKDASPDTKVTPTMDERAAFAAQDKRAAERASEALLDSLVQRMEYTWGRAFVSLSVTTGTTVVAFLATALSRIVPISTFGIFAATIVFVNYCLALTLYPAAIVLWERNVRPCEASCGASICALCGAADDGTPPSKSASTVHLQESPVASVTSDGVDRRASASSSVAAAAVAPTVEDSNAKSTNQDHEEEMQHRPIEIFFRDYWSEWIQAGRFPILAGFGVLLAVFAYFASTVGPSSEGPAFFPQYFYIGRALGWLDYAFGASDRDSTVEVDITWGVAGINRDGTTRFEPANPGKAIWDDSFDPSAPDAQQAILDTCASAAFGLGTLPGEDTPYFKTNVSCFMQDYADWLRDEQGDSFPFVAQGQGGSPASPVEQRTQFLASLEQYAQDSPAGQQQRAANFIGFDPDGNLRLLQISFALTLEQVQPFSTNEPYLNRMNAFLQERNRASPEGVNRALQTSGTWAQMQTERELLLTAIQGMGISIAVALVVLVISTTNFIVGALAVLSMTCIIIVVLGSFGLLGWDLGIVESVACVILVGFTVDYSVHLSVHFVTSKQSTAALRVKDSLTEMGVSIVAGAATTGGAGVFLFAGVIQFFFKFGVTLTVSIAASLLFSLGFLPAALCVLGPDRDTGSILPALDAMGIGWIVPGRDEEKGPSGTSRNDGTVEVKAVQVSPASGRAQPNAEVA